MARLAQLVAILLLAFRYLFVAPALLLDSTLRAVLFALFVGQRSTTRCRELVGSASTPATARIERLFAQRGESFAELWVRLPLPVAAAVAAYCFCTKLPLVGDFLERAAVLTLSAAAGTVSAPNLASAPKVVRCNKNFGLLLFGEGADRIAAVSSVAQSQQQQQQQQQQREPSITVTAASPSVRAFATESQQQRGTLTGRRATSSSASPVPGAGASPQPFGAMVEEHGHNDGDDDDEAERLGSPSSTKCEADGRAKSSSTEESPGGNEMSPRTAASVATTAAPSVAAASVPNSVVVWVDATAVRSAIPLWALTPELTGRVDEALSKNNGDKARVQHCQLVALRERADAPDAAGLLTPHSPHSPDVAAFPASIPAAASGGDDQSSRVLTEALAEGVVSAWSLCAGGGGRVTFVCLGYEAAAALLLAATSSSESMRHALANVIFFDSIILDGSGTAAFSSLSQQRDRDLLEELWRSLAPPIERLEPAAASALPAAHKAAEPAPLSPLSSQRQPSILKRRTSSDASAAEQDGRASTIASATAAGAAPPLSGVRRKPIFRVPSQNDWSAMLDLGASRCTTPTTNVVPSRAPTSPGQRSNDSTDGVSFTERGRRSPNDGAYGGGGGSGGGEEASPLSIEEQHAITAASGFFDSAEDLLSHADQPQAQQPQQRRKRFDFAAAVSNRDGHDTDRLFRSNMGAVAMRVRKSLQDAGVRFFFVVRSGGDIKTPAVSSATPLSPGAELVLSWFEQQRQQRTSGQSPLLLSLPQQDLLRPQPADVAAVACALWASPTAPLPLRAVRSACAALAWINTQTAVGSNHSVTDDDVVSDAPQPAAADAAAAFVLVALVEEVVALAP